MLHATHNTQIKINVTTFIIKHDKFWDTAFTANTMFLTLLGGHSAKGFPNISGISNMQIINHDSHRIF